VKRIRLGSASSLTILTVRRAIAMPQTLSSPEILRLKIMNSIHRCFYLIFIITLLITSPFTKKTHQAEAKVNGTLGGKTNLSAAQGQQAPVLRQKVIRFQNASHGSHVTWLDYVTFHFPSY
jgi:hypothetical protein